MIVDQEVTFSSKGDSKLAVPPRRIHFVRAEDGKTITVVTNDMKRSAVEIAQAYKSRWQIELLFRWLEPHLKIRKILGTNENAIKLQNWAAYELLRGRQGGPNPIRHSESHRTRAHPGKLALQYV